MHFCYILQSVEGDRTYNGYTNNLQRRLRQHNREICGGAKSTKGSCWKYLVCITSVEPWFTKNMALSLEWHIRYPTNKKPRPAKYKGAHGRLESLSLVFAKDAFKNKRFKVYVPEYHIEFIRISLFPFCDDRIQIYDICELLA